MANQYSKAVETKRSQRDRDAWKDKVDIGVLMRILSDGAIKGRPLKPTQIKAAEVVLDRLVPRLSATEITEVNELDSLSREEVLTRIQSLLQSDPTLLPELVGLEARKVHAEQVTSTVVQPKAGSAGG